MFGRFDDITVEKHLDAYLDDRVFLVLSPALRELSSRYGDLLPVEVWSEAKAVMERLICREKRRDVVIDNVYPGLLERYKIFVDADGQQIARTDEQAKRTTDMVMTVALFMLMSATKGDDNPHGEIMERLRSILRGSETAVSIIDSAMVNEEKEDKQYGEIPEHDYLAVPDKMAEARRMLQLPMTANFVHSRCISSYDGFVKELLADASIQEHLLGKKTVKKDFDVKSVYMILGMLIVKKVLTCTPGALCKHYEHSNSNKWMAPTANELPDTIKDIIENMVAKHFK